MEQLFQPFGLHLDDDYLARPAVSSFRLSPSLRLVIISQALWQAFVRCGPLSTNMMLELNLICPGNFWDSSRSERMNLMPHRISHWPEGALVYIT